jgi:glycogen debranching enzyme
MAVEVRGASLDELLSREWLAVNHLGGYATGTVAGLNTRKYHGLLVATMEPPVRRAVLLSRVEDTVVAGAKSDALANSEYPGTIFPRGFEALAAFSNDPFPRWAYQGDGWTLHKELHLLRGHNTVCLRYTLLAATQPVRLEVRPLLALRPIHELTYQWNGSLAADTQRKGFIHIAATGRTPNVYLAHDGSFENMSTWYLNTIYRREVERGYGGLEDLWMPGIFSWELSPGQAVHFVCSAEPPNLRKVVAEVEEASRAEDARRGLRLSGDASPHRRPRPAPDVAALLRAADQFMVEIPPPEPAPDDDDSADSANITPTPAEAVVAIMSAFPWAAPNLRDALIGLPGLLLTTGRLDEAGAYLSSLMALERNGLLPTEISEDGSGLRYEGADVSLWFIHAVHQYLQVAGAAGEERAGAYAARQALVAGLLRIIEHYRAGTDLGISIDADGLLQSRMPNLPTTWMDGKVGDWVVTPRAGMPVELNALWHNALCAVAELLSQNSPSVLERLLADELLQLAASMRRAFNERFWNETADCCYDVLNEQVSDPSIRPNQILAISLPFPVLAAEYGSRLLATVGKHLVVPMGLRTLAPFDPNYMSHYGGDVVSRDRAYHQGSAYPWLLGPWCDAMVRVHGCSDTIRPEIAGALRPCIEYLMGNGSGQLCELFDGDSPHAPGGAIASARSVGELLRAYFTHVLPTDRAAQIGWGDGNHPRPVRPSVDDRSDVRPDGTPTEKPGDKRNDKARPLSRRPDPIDQ